VNFSPGVDRESLNLAARRHLRDATFVEVFEMMDGQHPYKLVVRNGKGYPYVAHFHATDLFLVCKLAATHFEIGVYP
jgi:hypothetical protein